MNPRPTTKGVRTFCSYSFSHILLCYGKIEWESVMKTLADIGYEGNFNYEASGFIKDIPVELRPEGLAFMARVGHYLISRFEHYKKNQ